MGAESSKPEPSLFDKQLTEAPTESTDIDDDDDDIRTPQGVSQLDGRAIADTTASAARRAEGCPSDDIEKLDLTRRADGSDHMASNKIYSHSGQERGRARQPDHSEVVKPPGLPSRATELALCHQGNSGRVPPPLQPPRADHDDARNFFDYYRKERDVGKGAFANVFTGTDNSTKQDYKYTIKEITDRSKMMWNGRDLLLDEITSMIKLQKGPNIVHLHDYFLKPNLCYLVMDLLPGRTLIDQIIQKESFTEEEIRNACRCVLAALAYMHDKRITHRDLKPENLLLKDDSNLDKVKLSDFGFSRILKTKNDCKTLCGTPGYIAPEILERWPAYDVKCDIWSFGVILFQLLGGYLPFDAQSSKDVFELTRNGQYQFLPQRWKGISHPAKDLVAKCLTVSPNRRINSQGALAHEWMGEGLALPNTPISAKNLAMYYETKKHRLEKYRQRGDEDQGNRLKNLHADFALYLEERDSIISAVTKTGRTECGRSVPKCKEDNNTNRLSSELYEKKEKLGEGAFAKVYRCYHTISKMYFAVKEVDTTKLTPIATRILKEEVTALKYLRGAPNIIRLYDDFMEGNISYLVLEEMRGGTLMDRIIAKEVYTEREAREVCKALFSAVNYCHKKQIAHRDIKLENLLLYEENNDASIKLADFGFAKKVNEEYSLKTYLGTPHYMAPEIYGLKQQQSKGYDQRCDLWSLGVVVYCLLCGDYPFDANDVDALKIKVMHQECQFRADYGHISLSAKDLILGFLQKDCKHRLSAQQALESLWMMLDDAELAVVDLSLTKSRIEGMATATNKLKNAVRAIISVNRLKGAAGLGSSLEGNAMLDVQHMETVEESFKELSFESVYEIGEPIGAGSLAKIHSAKDDKGKEYSVKKVIRRYLHPSDFAALNDEIAVLQEIATGEKIHVVCLHKVYEDPDATYIVLERIHGDILINRIIEKKKYTEFDAKELVRNLLLGVRHCHEKRIAIRNLTLDNLMLSGDSESDVIITDFEMAKKALDPKSLKTRCGTLQFVAPEVLQHRPEYDISCDMWSVGVIVFILLGGYYPFGRSSDTEVEVLKNVRYGLYEFQEKVWEGVSSKARLLVSAMMTVNPDERITAKDALKRDWIVADQSELSQDLMDTVTEIKKEVKKFKAAVKTVVAMQKLQCI